MIQNRADSPDTLPGSFERSRGGLPSPELHHEGHVLDDGVVLELVRRSRLHKEAGKNAGALYKFPRVSAGIGSKRSGFPGQDTTAPACLACRHLHACNSEISAEETDSWSHCQGARAAVHNKALWVVGGAGDKFQTFSNDAWFEDTNGWSCVPTERDGVCPASSLTWGIANPLTLAPNTSAYTPLSTFPPRAFHGLVSFQGFLWVIGGLVRMDWQQPLSDSNPTATKSCEKVCRIYICPQQFDTDF
jgi:hypothetical protein